MSPAALLVAARRMSGQLDCRVFAIAVLPDVAGPSDLANAASAFTPNTSCTLALDANGYTTTKTVIHTNQCCYEVILWPRFHEKVVCLNDYLFAHHHPVVGVVGRALVLARNVRTMLEI